MWPCSSLKLSLSSQAAVPTWRGQSPHLQSLHSLGKQLGRCWLFQQDFFSHSICFSFPGLYRHLSQVKKGNNKCEFHIRLFDDLKSL